MQSSSTHIPVLLSEVLAAAEAVQARAGRHEGGPKLLDATFGRGGHARALLEAIPSSTLIGIDQDISAIEFGLNLLTQNETKQRAQLIHSNFADFNFSTHGLFDFILVDLGVSSPQLDEAQRGFSFYNDGPLDMRMDPTSSFTAKDVLHELSEDELNDLFKTLGEIPKPYRLVRALVHDRKTKEFNSTLELAKMIERIDGWRVKGRHPATQYFLALRLFVNKELEVTEAALPKMIQALSPGGRLAVISFHSLEDRIVKRLFRGSELGRPVNKKVIEASDAEQKTNPRSRSAKLRVFERFALDEE